MFEPLTIASVKSFGDFVIAHSVIHRVDDVARPNVRLVSCIHVDGLNAILPSDVNVALLNSGFGRVPALFDVKKRGLLAAMKSAVSLRRAFDGVRRNRREVLVFDQIGARERYIAGSWPVISPRVRGSNIYNTYSHFLAERQIVVAPFLLPLPTSNARSVGIFPESRLIKKRLTTETLSVVFERVAAAGLDAKLFILDGDVSLLQHFAGLVKISRDFKSLANAIRSVDLVVSADSLPAHLAEYLRRPVFVAAASANEYWLPYGSFSGKHWGIFGDPAKFSCSLDAFFCDYRLRAGSP